MKIGKQCSHHPVCLLDHHLRVCLAFLLSDYNSHTLFVVQGIEPRPPALSHILTYFSLFISLRQSLAKSLTCPGWARICDPPASAFQNPEITGVHHSAQLALYSL